VISSTLTVSALIPVRRTIVRSDTLGRRMNTNPITIETAPRMIREILIAEHRPADLPLGPERTDDSRESGDR
jgi:hypothetical protein